MSADAKLIPSATQTAGPFFHFGLLRPEWADLTHGGKAQGEKISLEGRVTDGDGAPLPDAIVEIWQANAAGKYEHPDDAQDKPVDKNFRGFGRAFTDKDGIFRFTTVKPGPVPGRGNALQAPHIAVVVFSRGMLTHVFTRIYFADEPANAADPILAMVPADRRPTLIARRENGGPHPTWLFDVRLQGDGETVFFAL